LAMGENSLIKAAQAGDRQAFASLLEIHYDRIFRIAMQWCGHQQDAEDITQQVCVKLAKRLGQYRFESTFHTWLYRLVINCAKDWQRAQHKHQRGRQQPLPEQDLLDKQSSVTASPETLMYLLSLLTWVGNLGEGFRETLLLVFGEGLNHREAAEILQIKESTVSWRIHKMRKQLTQWHARDKGEV